MTSKKVCHIGNHYYLYERESYWDPVQKKTRQRNSTYIGKCDKDGNLIAPAKKRFDSIQSSFPVGPLSIFYSTAMDLQLTKHIQETVEVTDDIASHILCMVLNQVVGRRPVSKLTSWVHKSPIMTWEALDPKGINRKAFETALSNLCIIYPDGYVEDNGLALQYEMTKVWRGDTREPAQYYYDVTRQIYYGTNCSYAGRGYYPGGTHKHVLAFGLVVSRTNHHPVLCRAIRGTKHDSITVKDTVNTLKAWDFKGLTLVLDRGMVSKENVEFVVKSGFDQVGIVPDTSNDAWEYVTKWPSKGLSKAQFLVMRPSGATVYVRGWTAPLFEQKKMRVAVVEDSERKVQESLARDQLLRELKGTPSKKRLKEIRAELGEQVKPARGRRGFVVNQDKVKEDQKGDGRFLMFSTDPKMNAEDMFRVYFQKDVVEKAFRTVKGEIKLGPIRYRRTDRIEAYATIVYLAYLLWSVAERKLRKKFPEMTLAQALELVDDVAWVRFKSGKKDREWVTKLTRAQEKVLKLLGATPFLPVS